MDMPLHPLIVHFPIAFLYGALILQGVHLLRKNWICRVVGMWLLGLAALSSIFASITGEWELNKAGSVGYSTEILEIMNQHELVGNIITWGSTIICLGWVYLFFIYMDDRRVDKLAMAFLILLAALVSFTAFLGGQLVWIHGVGIPK